MLTAVTAKAATAKVSGWIGTARFPKQLDSEDAGNLNGIVVFARGRLFHENVLDKLNDGRLYTKYLTGQIEAVDRLVAAAETPLRVALASDNVTDVTIYRFGRLGNFERKDVELLPGRYTVVGVRAGFRDVRRQIDVVPGREAATVVIRCEEPI